MNSGIYKIINKLNNKCYIGSSINIKERWKNHKKDLYKNKHHSILLQRAYNKYGKQNFKFQIIERVESIKEKLLEREQFYLDILKPEYNILKIAGSCAGVKRSEEFKHKMRNLKLVNREKVLQQIEHLASLKRGTHLSVSQKEKLSKALSGRPGYKKTQEQKEKLKIFTLKRFEGKKLENHPNAKLNWDIVRNIRKEKQEGLSLSKLANKYNVKRACVWKVIKNYSWIEGEI